MEASTKHFTIKCSNLRRRLQNLLVKTKHFVIKEKNERIPAKLTLLSILASTKHLETKWHNFRKTTKFPPT